MGNANLHPVPDPDQQFDNRPRAVTSSFRIPTTLFDKVEAEAKRLDISKSHVYLRALTNYFEIFNSDSWSTVDDDDFYDPKRFYTHASDKHGHSFTTRVGIPKPMAGELAAIVESRAVPAYRSIKDFVRDAIYHRAKQISRAIDNGELEYAVDMAMLASEELQIIDEAEQADLLIDTIRTNAQAMFARDGSRPRLKRYLASRKELADSIPEPYRDDYLAAIADYEKRIEKAEAKKGK